MPEKPDVPSMVGAILSGKKVRFFKYEYFYNCPEPLTRAQRIQDDSRCLKSIKPDIWNTSISHDSVLMSIETQIRITEVQN